MVASGVRGKDPGKGREDKEGGPIGFMRSDRMLDEGGRRGDPAWMSAGAEDYGEDTPLLELRRQEFEAERRAMQASSPASILARYVKKSALSLDEESTAGLMKRVTSASLQQLQTLVTPEKQMSFFYTFLDSKGMEE